MSEKVEAGGTSAAVPAAPDRSKWRYLKDMVLPPDVQAQADQICKEWNCRKPADRQHVEENIKLQHFFGGQAVAYMITPQGMLIVCTGETLESESFGVLDVLPRSERCQITLYCPSIWNERTTMGEPAP